MGEGVITYIIQTGDNDHHTTLMINGGPLTGAWMFATFLLCPNTHTHTPILSSNKTVPVL